MLVLGAKYTQSKFTHQKIKKEFFTVNELAIEVQAKTVPEEQPATRRTPKLPAIMPQGNVKAKSKNPSRSQIKKKTAADRKPAHVTKKGKQLHGPRNATLADKLTKKLESGIRNKMEGAVMDKFYQGGGRLSIVTKKDMPVPEKKKSGSHR